MIKYRISGKDALPYLRRLLVRDVVKLAVGRVSYVAWCDDDGKVLDDGTLFRLADNVYRLCSQDRHLGWLQDSAVGFDVEIVDETDDIAALALQGPTSCAVLQRVGLDRIEWMKPFEQWDFDSGDGVPQHMENAVKVDTFNTIGARKA